MKAVMEGIRVLDLTRLFPGGYLTTILRQMGAEIIKVEPPWGDDARTEEPCVDGKSYYHQAINRGKKSLVLDLKQADGVDVLRDLARGADVLVENFRPGVTQRLGIGPEDIRIVNPTLFYLSLTGYGSQSSRAQEAGHDLNYLATTGMLEILGMTDLVPGLFVSDVVGALFGVITILAALYQRKQLGLSPASAEVAFSDAIQHIAVLQQAHFRVAGTPHLPMMKWPSYHIYRTRDGRHLAVGAIERRFWVTFSGLVEHPEWSDRGRDPTLVGEVAHLVGLRSLDEWIDTFRGHDCCVTAVRGFQEAMSDPGLNPEPIPPNQWLRWEHESVPEPEFGQHSIQILKDLGYSTARISRLLAVGVIQKQEGK